MYNNGEISTAEITSATTIISLIIKLAKLFSDMQKYPNKKFEKILRELRSYKVNPETIVDVLSLIIEGQRCEV